eukprot:758449-Hanusia_phi.AAC.7
MQKKLFEAQSNVIEISSRLSYGRLKELLYFVTEAKDLLDSTVSDCLLESDEKARIKLLEEENFALRSACKCMPSHNLDRAVRVEPRALDNSFLSNQETPLSEKFIAPQHWLRAHFEEICKELEEVNHMVRQIHLKDDEASMPQPHQAFAGTDYQSKAVSIRSKWPENKSEGTAENPLINFFPSVINKGKGNLDSVFGQIKKMVEIPLEQNEHNLFGLLSSNERSSTQREGRRFKAGAGAVSHNATPGHDVHGESLAMTVLAGVNLLRSLAASRRWSQFSSR